jgi:oligopeptide/dipeptide ABC transporter ATP-binding protein
MSDHIGVMYLGNLVEYGESEKIIKEPLHPYTKALLSAVPVPDPTVTRGRTEIMGDLPSPINLPTGCTFHPRCLYAKAVCKESKPETKEVMPGHFVQCHFGGDISFDAAKIPAFEKVVEAAAQAEET